MAIADYRSALVTGASSGIGAAVVSALADKGLNVHAVARRQDRLAHLAETTGCTTHALDLRDTAALYETMGELEIDIVVNNAGLGRGFEVLHRVAPEDIDTTMETNVAIS